MKSIIRSNQFNAEKILYYPFAKLDQYKILEKQYQRLAPDFAEHCHSILLDGLHIEIRNVTVHKSFWLEVEHDFPLLKMQFELNGYSHFESFIDGVPNVEIEESSHQLLYIPQVNGRLTYHKNRETLEIKMSLAFLKRAFNNDLSLFGHFEKALLQNEPALLFNQKMQITPPMVDVINQIKRCRFTDHVKAVYLHCKVVELLVMQLNQYLMAIKFSPISLPHKNLEKLLYVKRLIETNLQKPKTIVQLAKLSGLNDFILKKEFKAQFACTLFEYLTTVRLEKGKILLLEGKAIKEASYLAGYKHQQHFTAAFKRKYGYLPSKINSAIKL